MSGYVDSRRFIEAAIKVPPMGTAHARLAGVLESCINNGLTVQEVNALLERLAIEMEG
jgi:hypothetical protein